MPILKNTKREIFAQNIFSGQDNMTAYVNAGYKPNLGNATHMRMIPEVKARIEELLSARLAKVDKKVDASIKKAAINRDWVMAKLIENYEQAFLNCDFSPANKALELLGKELGMFIERKETGGPGDFARMNDDELRNFIAQSIAGASGKLSRTEH